MPLLATLAMLGGVAFAHTTPAAPKCPSIDLARENANVVEQAVRVLLERQVRDWNRGDIEAFMRGYWRSPDLVFDSGDKELVGWEAARDHYFKTYGGNRQTMGDLAFTNLKIVPLAADAAVCWGHWRLKFASGSPAKAGLFTLVLVHRPEGWRIIHDHTS